MPARPPRAGASRGAAGQRSGTGHQVGEQPVALLDVGDVLDVAAGGLAQRLTGLEHEHPQTRGAVGQLTGHGRPDRAAPHDEDVDAGLGAAHRTPAGCVSRSRLSMSCCARTWSKALYRSL